MIRKAVLLLAGWAMLQLIGSCCNCNGHERWDSMTVSLVSVQNEQVLPADGDTVAAGSWGFAVQLNAVYEALLWEHLPQCQTAVACKCDTRIEDPVAGVRFVSLQRWDAAHDAGSDIADALEIRGGQYSRAADTLFRPAADSAAAVLIRDVTAYLRPAGGRAVVPGPHQVVVTATLESGRTISSNLFFTVR